MRILPLQSLIPSPNYLSCQILFEETLTQEQETDSLPIENDHVGIENDPTVVDNQAVDSPVQHN